MTTSTKKKKEVILSAANVVNSFGTQIVHKNVNLDVMRGEIIGIVGGSGSGKSVLLKTMLGLHKPNKGEVLINGKLTRDITSRESASLLGVLFQEGALFSSLNVIQNIILPLKEYTDLDKSEQEELARLKLSAVGLSSDVAYKFPSELSGGMTKRVAMARALAMDPQILFLDEPTSGLDPVSANEMDELILKLKETLQITVVMVTHDLNTLFNICDRVAAVVDKKIIAGTLPELLKSDNEWIQEFLGGIRGQSAEWAAKHHKKR